MPGTAVPPVAAQQSGSLGRRSRLYVAVATVALLLSACGTGSTSQDATSQVADDDGGASVAASSDDQGGAADADLGDSAGEGSADESSADETSADEISAEDGAGASAEEPESGDRADGPTLDVPAVEVRDIADGSVISLVDELAGEDRAILFWFWAPH